MLNKRGGRFRWMIFSPLLAVIIALLLGAAVQFLWNAILPGLVNVKPISYWKAVGLLVLCRILFGGFGKGPRGNRMNMQGGGRWRDKLMNMTPEERARFREEWRNRCNPRKDRN